MSTRKTARPVAHWVLLGTILTVIVLGMLVSLPMGLIQPGLYSASESGSSKGVPSAVVNGGPGVGFSNGKPELIKVKPKHIALTFDDGPDPQWTPQILELLAEHDVNGTFFVLGNQALRHPDILRRATEEGNELGVHSFTHPNLNAIDAQRVLFEARTTQLLIAGATGQKTALFRPPFSSTNGAVDDASWDVLKTTGTAGYLNVLTTLDSKDWEEPDVDAAVAKLIPKGSSGEVIMFHDSGGDRSRTLLILDKLIPQLKAKGYTVGTASEALGLTAASVPASGPEAALGAVSVWGLWACATLLSTVAWALVACGVLAVTRVLLLFAFAGAHKRVSARRPDAGPTGPITVIVPAYNEALGVEATIRSLLASTHPVEVIVVDDGSTDGTGDIVERLNLPHVTLIRKPNGGKPSALNAGIAAATTELVIMVDGDTIFEPETVANVVKGFADPEVGAVSGNAKVANRRGLLGRWQHIEYVIGFNIDRRFYDLMGCMPTVPGAVGGFRRSVLLEVGGVPTDTLAEDTDLTMAIGEAGYKVVHRSDAIAWTEAPQNIKTLWKQRYRWCYGTMQSMWKHRGGMLKRGRGGRYTRRALSYMTLFQVILPLLGPAIDLYAIYGLIVLDPLRTIAVWCAFQALDLSVALFAFHLDGEKKRVLWALPLTQFFYRQLMYLVVIQSLATAIAGSVLPWHHVERYGTFKGQESGASGSALAA